MSNERMTDAALADALEAASNRCHGQDVAALRKAAAALRARPQAVAESVAKDAARYRFIRDENTNVGNIIDKRDGIHTGVHGEFMGYMYSYRCGADLDARIDAALRARPQAVAEDGKYARDGLVIHTPLPVFSDGPWIFSETGQSFTGDELNVEAFCRYRNALLAAPVPYGFGHLPQVATEDMQDNMRTALIDQGWTSDSAGEVDFQDIWDAAVVQFVLSAEDAYAAILDANEATKDE